MNLYRVFIKFTDGDFTVDAWATMPQQAQHMALIDARMLHPNGTYFGKVLSTDVQPVCDLRIEAFLIDDEFERNLADVYGVKITERDKAPYEWCFRGTRTSLLQMLQDHWGPNEDFDLTRIKEVTE